MSESAYEVDCVLDFTLDVVTPKWNINIILEFITEGDSLSFGELSNRIPDISPRMLSMRIKFLIDQGLLVPITNKEKPKKMRYKISDMGLDLARVLKLLREWGLKYGNCTNQKCISNDCKHGIAINRLLQLEIAN